MRLLMRGRQQKERRSVAFNTRRPPTIKQLKKKEKKMYIISRNVKNSHKNNRIPQEGSKTLCFDVELLG